MRSGLAVFAALVAVYSITANWGPVGAWNDTVAASAGAEAISRHGLPWISPELAERLPWMIPGRDGALVPNRFPGAMYLAAPLYLMDEGFSLAPGTAVAVLSTAAGATLLGFSLRPRHGRTASVVASLLIGLATPAWGLASQALWTHGPALLFLGGAAHAYARRRPTIAGWLLGGLVFVRPSMAVLVAVAALARLVRHRRIGVLAHYVPAAWGAVAYVVYNLAVLGRLTLTGGYGDVPVDRLEGATLGAFAVTIVAGLLSPARGFLLQTSIVSPAAHPARWASAPEWLRFLVVGGGAYVLFTWAADGYSGGAGQETYRYPLELVALMLLMVAPWLSGSRSKSWLPPAATGLSVGLQAVAALADGPYTVTQDAMGLVVGDWVDVPLRAWVTGGLVAVLSALLVGRWMRREGNPSPSSTVSAGHSP